jgi:hypothetical protein
MTRLIYQSKVTGDIFPMADLLLLWASHQGCLNKSSESNSEEMLSAVWSRATNM